MNTDVVLVVEDDGECRDAVAQALRFEGYAVVEARNGREALDYLLASQSQPFAIVLDLEMPVMSGWELLTLLGNYHRLASIPVLILTGREAPARVLRYGSVVKHVPKPCDPYELARMLEPFATKFTSGTWRTRA